MIGGQLNFGNMRSYLLSSKILITTQTLIKSPPMSQPFLWQSLLPFGSIDSHYLDAVHLEDLESIRLWRESQIAILRQNKPISQEEQLRYWQEIAFVEIAQNPPKQILFAYRSKQTLIGYGGFVHIDWSQSSAELSSLLSTSFPEPSETFYALTRSYIELSLDLAKAVGLKELTAQCYDFRLNFMERLESIGFEKVGYKIRAKSIEANASLPSFWAGAWLFSIQL